MILVKLKNVVRIERVCCNFLYWAYVQASWRNHISYRIKKNLDAIRSILNVFLFLAGPEGLEPSTNCSAGSHSIQAELWAQHFSLSSNNYDADGNDSRNSNISFFYIPQLKPRCTRRHTQTHRYRETYIYVHLARFFNSRISINALFKWPCDHFWGFIIFALICCGKVVAKVLIALSL